MPKKTKAVRNPFYADIRNPFYADIRKNGIVVDMPLTEAPRTGRPRRGERRLPTAVRSVRLPEALWKLVSDQAKREKISLNAALRQAAQIWVRS